MFLSSYNIVLELMKESVLGNITQRLSKNFGQYCTSLDLSYTCEE